MKILNLFLLLHMIISFGVIVCWLLIWICYFVGLVISFAGLFKRLFVSKPAFYGLEPLPKPFARFQIKQVLLVGVGFLLLELGNEFQKCVEWRRFWSFVDLDAAVSETVFQQNILVKFYHFLVILEIENFLKICKLIIFSFLINIDDCNIVYSVLLVLVIGVHDQLIYQLSLVRFTLPFLFFNFAFELFQVWNLDWDLLLVLDLISLPVVNNELSFLVVQEIERFFIFYIESLKLQIVKVFEWTLTRLFFYLQL